MIALASICFGGASSVAHAQSAPRNPDDWRENYAYTLGVQAFAVGYPYIYMPALRWAFVAKPPPNDMTPYAPVNHFFHFRRLADAT